MGLFLYLGRDFVILSIPGHVLLQHFHLGLFEDVGLQLVALSVGSFFLKIFDRKEGNLGASEKTLPQSIYKTMTHWEYISLSHRGMSSIDFELSHPDYI
jgi:hypothetical protein